MPPNQANTCVQCLKSKIDITKDVTKEVRLTHCKECNRYRKPPWKHLEPESPQLLSFCLKSAKGINKGVKLIDAAFIWTEPHSRRILVKVTV